MLFYQLLFTCLIANGTAITDVTVHNLASHNESFAFSENRAGTVVITWQTDQPSSSLVVYGSSAESLELSSRFDPHLKTKHIMRLQYRLLEGQTYFFQVVSRDATGLESRSTPASFFVPTDSQWWEVGHNRFYKKDNFNDGTRWLQGGNYYRTQVTLNGSVASAWVHTNRWERHEGGVKIYVNGTLAGTQSFGYQLDTIDIASFLVQGENTIALGVDATESIRILLDGEVVLSDDSRVPLQTTSSNWRMSTIAEAGWEQSGFNDSAWSEATPASVPSANSGFYSPLLLASLPGRTALNEHLLAYTSVLSRRDRILDQHLLKLNNDRRYLSIDALYKNEAETIALACQTALYDAQSSIDAALAAINTNDKATALTLMDTVATTLDDVELMCEVLNLLLDVTSEAMYLNCLATLADGPNNFSANAGTLFSGLANVLAQTGAQNYSNARDLLEDLEVSVDQIIDTYECQSDLKTADFNDSPYSPFGWIRARGRYLDRLFNNYYDTNNGVLRVGGESFATMPSDLLPQFRDSADFISPFVGINTSGTSLDVSTGMTHLAFEISSTVVRATSADPLYSKNDNGAWTKPWLLLWDATVGNRVYLLVFQSTPDSLSFVDGKIRIARAAGVGEIIVHHMYPQSNSLTSDTSAIGTWESGLPAAVLADVERLTGIMHRMPLGYADLYEEDSANELGRIKTRYFYHELNSEWTVTTESIAPLPNAAALALDNSYTGLGVTESLTGSRQSMSGWGEWRFASSDTLNYQFPLLSSNLLNGVNETITRGFIHQDKIANSGFNAIRGQIIIQDEAGGSGGFVLREGWQTTLMNELSEANDLGLKAIFFIWNNGGRSDNLDVTTEYQDAFVNAWGQVASIARDYDVMYNLTNEPEFNEASVYNEVMGRAAAAIRVQDDTNPITIEGFEDFAQNFTGMVHPQDNYPTADNIIFQFHPYNNAIHHNMSAIDQYYPGYLMSWWDNGYYDLDAYIAERWVPALRTMWTDDRIRLMNGEYGFQQAPTGVAEVMAEDSVYLARRFGVHQMYFVSVGWSGFDLYGGEGDTFAERTSITNILTSLSGPPSNAYCAFQSGFPAWQNDSTTDPCGNSGVTVLDLVAYVNNGYACTPGN